MAIALNASWTQVQVGAKDMSKQNQAQKTGRDPKPQADPSKGKSAGVEGEGSYTATRRYNEKLGKYIETGDVEEDAEAAKRALEGDEREELEEAERRAKRGPKAAASKP
jgi:hypothetical protein